MNPCVVSASILAPFCFLLAPFGSLSVVFFQAPESTSHPQIVVCALTDFRSLLIFFLRAWSGMLPLATWIRSGPEGAQGVLGFVAVRCNALYFLLVYFFIFSLTLLFLFFILCADYILWI
jgi:hypothetical protein